MGGTYTVTNTNTSAHIVFTPSSPFEPNSSIRVYVVYDTYIYDYAGNIVNSTSSAFTTTSGTDTTHPTVTSVTPPNGATAVGQNTPVILTFSKPLNPSTVNSSNFSLFNGSKAISTNISISPDSSTVTLTGALPSGALINVEVTTGVTDLVGNALASNFSSSFTAATVTPSTNPTVVTMRPASGATGVPANTPITLITSSPMNPSTIPGALNVRAKFPVLSLDATGQSILFTPAAPFAAGALVQVFLGTSATDVNGNTLTNFTGSFTVLASQQTTVPSVVSISPTNGATINVLNR